MPAIFKSRSRIRRNAAGTVNSGVSPGNRSGIGSPVALLEVARRHMPQPTRSTSEIFHVAFDSASSPKILVAQEFIIHVLDWQTGESFLKIEPRKGYWFRAAALSPDGSRIAFSDVTLGGTW